MFLIKGLDMIWLDDLRETNLNSKRGLKTASLKFACWMIRSHHKMGKSSLKSQMPGSTVHARIQHKLKNWSDAWLLTDSYPKHHFVVCKPLCPTKKTVCYLWNWWKNNVTLYVDCLNASFFQTKNITCICVFGRPRRHVVTAPCAQDVPSPDPSGGGTSGGSSAPESFSKPWRNQGVELSRYMSLPGNETKP